MHIKQKHFIIISSLIFFIPLKFLFAQTLYEPLQKDVYYFLEKLSNKGIINHNSIILPISRNYIASKLLELDSKNYKLSNLEKDKLLFYKADYGYEIELIKKAPNMDSNVKNSVFLKKDKFGRFRFFHYSDSFISLNIDPILGIKYTNWNKNNFIHLWNGLTIYGYLADNIAFNMNFRDNSISGTVDDTLNVFNKQQGRVLNSPNNFEYNIMNAYLTYGWSFGNVSIGKNPFEWGLGQSGKIVHSNKAPSYPNIRLDLILTDWLYFNYLHGWLNSEVVDSNKTYLSLSQFAERSRKIYIDKYFATHSFVIKPLENFYIALGESIIYSDKLKFPYLIPIMFFRLADHYLSSHRNDFGDNAQFFLQLSLKNIFNKIHIYSSLFIDEIRINEIFDPNTQKNQIGYNLGISISDFLSFNNKITIEYTRLNPFVYQHYIETQLYQNQGFNLGHWIGHNSDLLYLGYEHEYARGLKSNIFMQFIRKGSEGDPDLMYHLPQPNFLFGIKKSFMFLGINLRYEFIHDLYIKTEYQYSILEEELENHLTYKNKLNKFSLAFYYGL